MNSLPIHQRAPALGLGMQIQTVILRSPKSLFFLHQAKFLFLDYCLLFRHKERQLDEKDLGLDRTLIIIGVNARAPSDAIKEIVVLLSSTKLCIKKEEGGGPCRSTTELP